MTHYRPAIITRAKDGDDDLSQYELDQLLGEYPLPLGGQDQMGGDR